MTMGAADRQEYERYLTQLRSQLELAELATFTREGSRMTIQEILKEITDWEETRWNQYEPIS